MFTVAGFQVPVIPFVEVVGSEGATDPVQIGFTAANVGVMPELTTRFKVIVPAHCPAAGVNVYVPDAVLLTVAGFQVPAMPLVEVAGNIGGTEPLQIVLTAAKVGVRFGLTVTVVVVLLAHCPAAGVNV